MGSPSFEGSLLGQRGVGRCDRVCGTSRGARSTVTDTGRTVAQGHHDRDNQSMSLKGVGTTVAVVLFVIWSVVALQWYDKGCTIGHSYQHALQHGSPDLLEVLVYCGGD